MSLDKEMFNVLIIDDDINTCDSIELSLIAEGICKRIIKANDGIEGFRKITNMDFDAVIIDNIMPKRGGLELIKLIKTLKAYRDTPIIFMSTEMDRDEAQDAINLGVENILVKPFDESQMLNMVKEACQKGTEATESDEKSHPLADEHINKLVS